MSSLNTVSTRLTITSLIITSTLVSAQPASAQILELATGALSILNSVTGNSQSQQARQQVAPPPVRPQQLPANPKFNVGAGNLNGNKINLCISNCLPVGSNVNPPGAVVQPAPTAQ